MRPVYRFVLENHEVAELPSSLFLPGVARLQLADGIRVVPVITLGFKNDDLAGSGPDDEIRVVIDESVDPEPALFDVPVPELDIRQVGNVIDDPLFKPISLFFGHIEAVGNGWPHQVRSDELGKLEARGGDDLFCCQPVTEHLLTVVSGQLADLLLDLGYSNSADPCWV